MENWLVSGIILILILAVIVFFTLGSKSKFTQKDKTFFSNQWRKILSEKNQQVAIMEADKILDLVLRKKGYKGPLGAKLKKHGKLFSDLDGIWKAHKLRNRIAHEINISLTPREFRAALNSFQKALNDLKALN